MSGKPIRKTCQECRQRYWARDERPNRKSKYCSRRCRDSARRDWVTLTCVQCGQKFERKRYLENWSNERGPFCGFPCYGQWQSGHMQGEANPNFVPQSNARIAGQLERNRHRALERDHHRCIQCGEIEKRLCVHHIVEWEPGQSNPHALDNLETLCISCHLRLHARRRNARGQFAAQSQQANA